MGTKKVGVLISGRGSNLQALIDAQHEGELGGEIAVVFSNVDSAAGLQRARRAGIPVVVRDHHGRRREEFDAELAQLLEAHGVELVCLAGYMRLLSAAFIRRFAGRILNVHPALLPCFPGLHAQRLAALDLLLEVRRVNHLDGPARQLSELFFYRNDQRLSSLCLSTRSRARAAAL